MWLHKNSPAVADGKEKGVKMQMEEGSWQEGVPIPIQLRECRVSGQEVLLPWQGFWQDGFQV